MIKSLSSFKELVDSLGGLREVAYRLNYDMNHMRNVYNGRLPFTGNMAFRFLEQYPELSLKDLKTLME